MDGYRSNTLGYDHRNLPLIIKRGAADSTLYNYDDKGLRVAKNIKNTTKEYYLRDQDGRELGVYDLATGRERCLTCTATVCAAGL